MTVQRTKRRKCGKVVWETQLDVQGQWWSILGMHLGIMHVSLDLDVFIAR